MVLCVHQTHPTHGKIGDSDMANKSIFVQDTKNNY